MVSEVRAGRSERSVALEYGVSLSAVQYWVQRAEGQRLDRVHWSDRPGGPRQAANRTPRKLEDMVLRLRRELRDESALGEFGGSAIRAELERQGVMPLPAVRTVYRILERRGALDYRRRIRRPAPMPGWYLPDVAMSSAEVDELDAIEGLVIKGGPQIEVLNLISVHGGLCAAWPSAGLRAETVREKLLQHWQEYGLPDYAQFDNDTLFQGPHQHRDVISSVMRLCLSLGVVPVFAPPRETGFQAAVESFNGRWQAKVWTRFQHESLQALQAQSARYVAAHRQRTALRREAAPERRVFPAGWSLDLQARPQGRVIFLRRTTAQGHAMFLGRTFEVDSTWPHRLVRCDVDLNNNVIRFYALRRRAPEQQPLLREVPYALPDRRFRE